LEDLSVPGYPSPTTNRSLKQAWNLTQLGLLLLPLMPALGEVGLVLAFIITWQQHYRRLVQYPLNWGLGLFSLWLILTSFIAFKPQEAFLGLPNFLPFIIFLAASPLLIQQPSQLHRLAWLLVIPSPLVVILGLGQLFWGWVSPQWLINILGWELVAQGNPPGRMSSVFIYANILAAYLLIVFILGLGLWIDTYLRWRQDLKNQQSWIWIFLSLAIGGDGIGLILTNSRNAWALAILGCLAFALYSGWHLLILGIATATSSVLWASWGPSPEREWLRQLIPAYFWARLTDELYPDRPLATLRTTQWQFAWDMTMQRPWMGWGLRNFTPLYEAKMGTWLGHPHSLFLMLAAETGIPGVLLLSGIVAWTMAQGSRLLRTQPKAPEEKKQQKSNRLLLFTYFVAFSSCVLFNGLDVTLFDLRVNTLGWVIFSAIYGLVYRYSSTI
jgi:O-antigen ligase